MMTRQHYKVIASSIKHMPLTNLARIVVAEHMAADLQKDNPNFKRDVFLAACGVPEE